ncbi:hypothetical protein B0H17DRAFT_1148554 [Mycena rosella]|uniref:Uncharacterized protein n=1 Tax=Mycena rosella TaxID=1033263 RepID=A0AAD7CBW3_MYCRO|nr:hypothetical protein B0H17DRAFT_1148554 [Mycena rosella]
MGAERERDGIPRLSNNLKSGMDSGNSTLFRAPSVHFTSLSIFHTSKSLLKFLITLNAGKIAEMYSTTCDEEIFESNKENQENMYIRTFNTNHADVKTKIWNPDVRSLTNKAAAMNGQHTASGIGELLLDLYERTGIRGFAVLSRGNPDDAALPHAVDSDDYMGTFFTKAYNLSNLDLLRNFELHSCVMDNGNKTKNDLMSVPREIVRVQLEGLRELLLSPWSGLSADASLREGVEGQEGSNVLRKLRVRDPRAEGVRGRQLAGGRCHGAPLEDVRRGCAWHPRLLQGRPHVLAQDVQGGAHPAPGRPHRLGFLWKKAKARVAGKGRAAAKRDEDSDEDSDEDDDQSSEEESEKGDEDNSKGPPPTTTTTGASAAAPSSFVPAALSSSFVSSPRAFEAPAPPTLHLTDGNGNFLRAASPAHMPALPTFNPDFFNFDGIDFDSLGPVDTNAAPQLSLDNYAFLNSFNTPAIVENYSTPTVAIAAAAHLVPNAGTSMGGSTGIFAVTKNTNVAPKQRKHVEQGGGSKKKTKSAAGASDAPAAASAALNTPVQKKRKQRSNAGTKRVGSAPPPERQRAVRKDKGQKWGPRVA